jgi:penicillin amidase
MLGAFDAWDGEITADSRAVPLAHLMRNAFRDRILNTILNREQAQMMRLASISVFLDSVITNKPPEWLPTEFDSYESLILACYKQAREELTKQLGPDESQWKWGRCEQIRFPHPLASLPNVGKQFSIAPIPQNTGGNNTVNAGGNVSMRFIADLSSWDNTRQGIALGQSGDPANSHWKDQLADWQAATPRSFPFTTSAVSKAARDTVVLVPPAK